MAEIQTRALACGATLFGPEFPALNALVGFLIKFLRDCRTPALVGQRSHNDIFLIVALGDAQGVANDEFL